MKWQIYYSDHVVEGETEEDWRNAPDDDVQVIERDNPEIEPHMSPWTGVVGKDLWTGEDEYDPFGYGVKYGRLISDDEYDRIWHDACS